MNVIYETPNKEWVITKEAGGEWFSLFGVPIYTARKRNTNNQDENEKKEYNSKNYTLMHSFEKIESGFRWLRYVKVISSDEMRHQISLLTEQ